MNIQYVTITNPTGIHARPASQLVELCQRYQSKIVLKREGNDTPVDGKSIFSVLAGRLKPGTNVSVTAEGPDEDKAVEDICGFIRALEE